MKASSVRTNSAVTDAILKLTGKNMSAQAVMCNVYDDPTSTFRIASYLWLVSGAVLRKTYGTVSKFLENYISSSSGVVAEGKFYSSPEKDKRPIVAITNSVQRAIEPLLESAGFLRSVSFRGNGETALTFWVKLPATGTLFPEEAKQWRECRKDMYLYPSEFSYFPACCGARLNFQERWEARNLVRPVQLLVVSCYATERAKTAGLLSEGYVPVLAWTHLKKKRLLFVGHPEPTRRREVRRIDTQDPRTKLSAAL